MVVVEAVIMNNIVDIINMVVVAIIIVMVIFHELHLVVPILISISNIIINNISSNNNNTSNSLNIVPVDNIGHPGMLKSVDRIGAIETRQPQGNTLLPRYTVWELNDKEIVITDSLDPQVPVDEPLEVVHGLQDLPEAHGSPWAHEGLEDRDPPNTTTIIIIVQANL